MGMRMTNQMSVNVFLNNLYKNNQTNNKYYNQLASNKRITRLSDDPIGVVRAIQARRDVSKKTQYKSNIEDANGILTQSETSAMQLNELYQRALELTKSAETDLYDVAERKAVASELKGIRDELIGIGNTTYAGKYIFGGYNTGKAPFELDDSGNLMYNGIDLSTGDLSAEVNQIAEYEVDARTNIEVGVTGVELMGSGEESAYKVLDDLIKALEDESTTVEDITQFENKLYTVRNNNLALISDIGGRTARLELLTNRTEDELLNLETMRSNIEDVDMSEAIMNLSFASAIYNASLQIGARILQPSLVDYLR